MNLKDLLESSCAAVTKALLKAFPNEDEFTSKPRSVIANDTGSVSQTTVTSCDAVKSIALCTKFLQGKGFSIEKNSGRTLVMIQRSNFATTELSCVVSIHGLADDGSDLELIVITTAAS